MTNFIWDSNSSSDDLHWLTHLLIDLIGIGIEIGTWTVIMIVRVSDIKIRIRIWIGIVISF